MATPTPNDYATFCRDLMLQNFERRGLYPIGSLERALCVEEARNFLQWHRSARKVPPRGEPQTITPNPELNSAQRRRNRLMLEHPDPSPLQVQTVNYLIHPPGRRAPTAKFIDFRDHCLAPMMEDTPDDRNLPRYAAAVQIVLDWRAGIPLEDRFWLPDVPFYLQEIKGNFRRRKLYPIGSTRRAEQCQLTREFIKLYLEHRTTG